MSEEVVGGETSTSSASPETSSSSASQSLEASSPAVIQGTSSQPSAQPNASTPQVPAAYVPNHKFKFSAPNSAKQQEKEFDEWAKALVKDAATEKEMRKLYEMGHGIENIKNDRTQLRSQLEKVTQEHVGLRNAVNQATGFVQKGDFRSFFETLKIPEQAIFKWVHDRIQFMQKPAHEQAAHEQLRQQQQQMQQLQEQNQQMQGVAEQYAVHMRTNEMESYLGRPDLANFAQQYDSRVGQPGAFRKAIIERGQYHAHTTGKDISPTQAINEVLSLLGALAPQNQAPQTQQNFASQPPSQPEGQEQVQEGMQRGQQAASPRMKPVMTNVQGRSGASPVKKNPRSIADLKKMAKEAAA